MPNLSSARRQAAPLPAPTRSKLRRAVERDGIRVVAQRLGVAPNTITRALAALGLYPGTALMIESRLAERVP